jgi:hypothetical protein
MPRNRELHRRSARSPRPMLLLLGGVAVVLVALVGWLASEARTAKSALDDAASQAKSLQVQVKNGDSDKAGATLAALQQSTTEARANTDGPLWGAAAALPFVGDSVSGVQQVTTSLDDIATRGLPAVVKASSSLDADVFQPRNGKFDLAKLAGLEPSVSTASRVLTANRDKISTIHVDDLVGPLRAPVTDLKSKIDGAQSVAASAARTMRLAPQMLGADGTRRYLLVFQNNAEVRSTGGLPGAFAIVEAKRGKVSIIKQGSATDIPQYSNPFVKLTKEEAAVYGQLMAKDFRDTNFTPDFPRTAEIMRAMVDDKVGVKVDGVLSLDPVALSMVLKGTGPIEVADDTRLTADNAVDVLLNGVYSRFEDPALQDAFFADSARRVFQATTSGIGDSRKTVSQMVKAADEHRVLLWSARKAEQREITDTVIAGSFPGADEAQPHVGMYLNDSTASKMQYYLDLKTTARSVRCTDDGRQTIEMTSTYISTAPADARSLPAYITGDGFAGPRGSMVLDTRFFAPAGGEFVSFTLNDKMRPNNGVSFHGRPVNFAAFTLKPGAKVRVVATMRTAKNQRDDVVLSTTPGAHSSDNGINVRSSCR